MTKEKRFYRTLKDIFVGAKIDGDSGFINLMKIKSRYYERGVFPKLQQDINEALQPFPDFRDELFDKLYTFFNRYFSESGSIYFTYTPIHQNVYEKVYTDDKDVILFWKTHMLYYVKTDRLFKNLEVELEKFKFFFDVSHLEHKKANEKREIIYDLKEPRNDGAIAFNVHYSEKGKKTKFDEITKTLKKYGIKISEDIIENALKLFEKQSEVDYFINKNAREFLNEQFNIWLYQYVFSGESEWKEVRIRQLQVLKETSSKIIDFISQFEDELVKIWNKPKFVLNSNYVITLDRIADRDIGVIDKLHDHNGFKLQIQEWKHLGIIDDNFVEEHIIEKDLSGKYITPKYKCLPIDTKYFKDLELDILRLFENLDESLDGWLIKSENYQALNTILPKFRENVQTIYIDPPFNKETEADYFYSVKYKNSTWISMLENRLRIAKGYLKNIGNIFVRCDYNGNMFVRLLMNMIFGEDSFVNQISIRRVKKNITGQGKLPIPDALDTIYVYFMPESQYLNIFLKHERKGYWRRMDDSSGVRRPPNREIFGKEFFPPEGKHFKFNQKKIDMMLSDGKIRLKCKNKNCFYEHYDGIWNGCPQCQSVNPLPEYYVEPSEQKSLDTNWTDIYGYSFDWKFQTENSEKLLQRVIDTTSRKGDVVMDYFLGSGTTTAVAHKLERKWIGIEMGEHFSTIVLPRMKEVLAGRGNREPSGISKEVKWKGGGFFKYFQLEQYEDCLKNVKYDDSDLFVNRYQDPYNQYVFMRDLKMLEALGVDYENNKVKVDLSKLYPNIDIPETLSNLKGKWIKRITIDAVEFNDGESINIKDLDYKTIMPLVWW